MIEWCRGHRARKTSYVNGKFIASNLCIVLTPQKKGKYKIDLEFYSHYLESIREEIKSELADGTSKLIIKPKELMEYYIPYIPYEAQKKFVEEHIRPLNKAKEELQQLTNDIDKSLEELY